jgi:hypothetical protein
MGVKPSFEICQGCPHWDDVNGCWKNITDVGDCVYIDKEEIFFSDDLYEEHQSLEEDDEEQ